MIIRAKEAPPIGRTVCDNHGRDLGSIVRVTGPVGSPYVIVRPKGQMPEGTMKMLGREIFLSRTPAPPRDRRKDRRGSPGKERYQPRQAQEPRYQKDRGQDRRRVHRSMDRPSRGWFLYLV